MTVWGRKIYRVELDISKEKDLQEAYEIREHLDNGKVILPWLESFKSYVPYKKCELYQFRIVDHVDSYYVEIEFKLSGLKCY